MRLAFLIFLSIMFLISGCGSEESKNENNEDNTLTSFAIGSASTFKVQTSNEYVIFGEHCTNYNIYSSNGTEYVSQSDIENNNYVYYFGNDNYTFSVSADRSDINPYLVVFYKSQNKTPQSLEKGKSYSLENATNYLYQVELESASTLIISTYRTYLKFYDSSLNYLGTSDTTLNLSNGTYYVLASSTYCSKSGGTFSISW